MHGFWQRVRGMWAAGWSASGGSGPGNQRPLSREAAVAAAAPAAAPGPDPRARGVVLLDAAALFLLPRFFSCFTDTVSAGGGGGGTAGGGVDREGVTDTGLAVAPVLAVAAGVNVSTGCVVGCELAECLPCPEEDPEGVDEWEPLVTA